VVDKDVLFNLHSRPSFIQRRNRMTRDLEHQVTTQCATPIDTAGPYQAEPGKYSDEYRTTATINSMLMNSLIPRGVSVEHSTCHSSSAFAPATSADWPALVSARRSSGRERQRRTF